jgi:hypothetical protein
VYDGSDCPECSFTSLSREERENLRGASSQSPCFHRWKGQENTLHSSKSTKIKQNGLRKKATGKLWLTH